MAKYDDLKKMRDDRDKAQPAATEQRADPAKIKEEQERLAAGEAVGGAPVETDDDDDDTSDETPAGEAVETQGDETPETVTVREHERAKPGKTKDVTVAPPGTEAVEIDGKTVYVAPELAAAYREAEQGKKAADEQAREDALADRLAARLQPQTAPATNAPKTSAETAAEKALADAEAEVAKLPPEPDPSLWINDPAAAQKQTEIRNKAVAALEVKKALAERDLRDATAARETKAQNDAQLEAQAREVLGNQFYEQYKVLAEPATRKLVDVLLEAKWNEIRQRLITNPPKTKAEGDALKKKCFIDVAAEATKQIVAIRQQGSNAAPPPPLPNLNTSRTRDPGKKVTPPVEKPKEKFPAGSVSAMLAKHKETKTGTKPAA